MPPPGRITATNGPSNCSRHIVADKRAIRRHKLSNCCSIAGRLFGFGEFPMAFTDTHDLSLDYLVSELIYYQKQDIAAIQDCVADLAMRSCRPARWRRKSWATPVGICNRWKSWQAADAETLMISDQTISGGICLGFYRVIRTYRCLPCSSTRTPISIRKNSTPIEPRSIARAIAAGVETIVAVGVTADSSAATVRLAAEHAGDVSPRSEFSPIIVARRSPAIGSESSNWPIRQRSWPSAKPGSIAIGITLRLPCSKIISTGTCGCRTRAQLAVHRPHPRKRCRRGGHAAQRLERGSARGRDALVHRHRATRPRECVKLGLYISFAGMVTFKKSDDLRAVAATVPDDRILIETDSPYLSPHPLRGKRNEPANLVHTARVLAEVRGVSDEQFAEQTTANAKTLFRIP